jgi:cation-transporting ATPase 13A2
MSRLRSSRIFCINPERINFAGWVNVVCWDKTGTLTDDQLDWQGIIYSKNQRFETPELETSHLPEVQTALVTCHGMNYVNGQAVGHFVDTEMLRATQWQMKQPSVEINAGNEDLHVVAAFYPPPSSQSKDELYVIKRFAFDAHICRSSVVVLSKTAEGPYQMTGSAKGSPEAIRQICRPDTVPYNFTEIYGKYAAQGFYILALAVKDRVTEFMEETPCAEEIRKLTRKTWETNMKFVGFMLFRSPIKPEAFSTIKTLTKAGIKSVIITGDNALNSIHVARDLRLVSRCVIINKSETTKRITFTEIPLLPEKWAPDPLERDLSDLPAFIKSYGDTKIDIAINSMALHNILEQYEEPFCQWLIRNTAIFARMKPKDKTLVIENLIEQGYYTAMTGNR